MNMMKTLNAIVAISFIVGILRWSSRRNMEKYEYAAIFNFVTDGKYPTGCNENEKRRIRGKCKNFQRVDDDLFYVKNGKKKTVVTSDRKNLILKVMHEKELCHLGRDKTSAAIASRYYWKNLNNDVRDYIRTCEKCQMKNKKTKTTVPEMTSVDIPPRIWEVIGIDLIGPFTRKDRNRTPLSNAGYRYVLTVIDYFSKWSEAFPLVSKDTVGIVEKLQTCIYRFGVPKKIISDRGGEFNSRAMDQFCSDNGIRHTCTSAYHPQANGLVEKFNSTLKRMINKTIEENGEEWEKYIEKCLFAYRCTIHSSSKFSPFYMLYLREPVLGSEQSLSWTQEDDQSEEAMGIDGAVERQVEKNWLQGEEKYTVQQLPILR